MMLAVILSLLVGTLFFVFFGLDLLLSAFRLAFGQELLPKPGTNQSLSTPNSNTTSNPPPNNPPSPSQSLLSPFLK